MSILDFKNDGWFFYINCMELTNWYQESITYMESVTGYFIAVIIIIHLIYTTIENDCSLMLWYGDESKHVCLE